MWILSCRSSNLFDTLFLALSWPLQDFCFSGKRWLSISVSAEMKQILRFKWNVVY